MFDVLGLTQTYFADNTIEALRLMNNRQMDLLIVDNKLSLPRDTLWPTLFAGKRPLSGHDFVRRLRHSPLSRNPFVPIIIFAPEITTEELLDARDSGANSIILKPLGALQFCNKLRDTISKPRIFITSSSYRGPCRRTAVSDSIREARERRKTIVQVIKFPERVQ
jgi:CheY-like chemotaxis protein